MKNENVKNKYFLPVVLLSFIVISVSLFSILDRRSNTENRKMSADNQQKNEMVTFSWQEGEKPVLLMSASQEVSIGAIDLYIGYKNVDVKGVKNFDELPEPAFSKVSANNSLVVLNYLIPEDDGFKIFPGQGVKVAEFEISSNSENGYELFIDGKTSIVDNDTVEMVPWRSEDLIINSTLE